MSTDIQIRQAVSDNDLLEIERLARAIWTAHYSPIIGMDQLTYMLAVFQSFDAMKEQIARGYTYYKVERKGVLVGYIATEIRDHSLFISKFYLAKNARGNGISRRMMTHLEKTAIHENLNSMTLTVNKNNAIAIQIYEHYGFENKGSIVIDIGNDYVMDDFKMVKKVP